MKYLNISKNKKRLSELIKELNEENESLVIGEDGKNKALLIKFPEKLNKNRKEITNINANSSSFEFLENEPDLYSREDLVEEYDG
jgi:hypothetical protein